MKAIRNNWRAAALAVTLQGICTLASPRIL